MKRIYLILCNAIMCVLPLYSMEIDLSQSMAEFPQDVSQKPKNLISKREICSTLQANIKNLNKEKNKKEFINNLEQLKNNKNIFNNPNVSKNIFKNKQINNLIDFIQNNPFNTNLIPTIKTQLQEICQKTTTSFNNITIKTSSALDSLLKAHNDFDKNKLLNDIDQNLHLMMDFMEMQNSQARITSLIKVLSEIKLSREDNALLTKENIKKWKTKILAASITSLEKKPLDTSEITLPQKEKEIEKNIEKQIKKHTAKTLRSRSYSTALKTPKISMDQQSKKLGSKEYESLPSSTITHKQQTSLYQNYTTKELWEKLATLFEQQDALENKNSEQYEALENNIQEILGTITPRMQSREKIEQGIILPQEQVSESPEHKQQINLNDTFATVVQKLKTMPVFHMLYEKKNQFIQDIIYLADQLTYANTEERDQLITLASHPLFENQQLLQDRYDILIKGMNKNTQQTFKAAWDTIINHILPAQTIEKEDLLLELPQEQIPHTTKSTKQPISTNAPFTIQSSEPIMREKIAQLNKQADENLAQLKREQLEQEKRKQEMSENLARLERAQLESEKLEQEAHKLEQDRIQQENAKRWIPWIINRFNQTRQTVFNFVNGIGSTITSWWSWFMGQ